MKRISYISMALALASCASVGTNYDMATVSSLTPGMTQAEVVQRLGEPNSRTNLGDGSEQWMWVYGHATAFGSAQSKAVLLRFGPDKRYAGIINSTQTQVR